MNSTVRRVKSKDSILAFAPCIRTFQQRIVLRLYTSLIVCVSSTVARCSMCTVERGTQFSARRHTVRETPVRSVHGVVRFLANCGCELRVASDARLLSSSVSGEAVESSTVNCKSLRFVCCTGMYVRSLSNGHS